MTKYELHFLRRGRTVRTHDFEAFDDQKAIEFSEVWLDDMAMELCSGDRLVKRWLKPQARPH
jgi:hypothetical protein